MKITLTNNSSYCEVPQVNPLRWKTLHKVGDNEFVDQSGWWKCKDFLNDTVAFFKQGSKFSIYSYKNDIKANDEGVYFLLNFIANKDRFQKNLEVVNKRLNADLGCKVDVVPVDDKKQLIILIPPVCWESTYRISMITLLIRLCNYDQEFKKWEDIWDSKSVLFKDGVVASSHTYFLNNAKTMGFAVPKQFQEYWYYAGPNYNSTKLPKQTGLIIHDDGILSWSMWMEQESKKVKKGATV